MKKMVLLLLFLPGCNLAPLYERPSMEISESWRVESNEEEGTCANIEWWHQLEDPVLDGLIAQSLQNNRDLQAAAWRVAEFFSRYQIVNARLLPQADLAGGAERVRFPEQASFLPFGFDPIQSEYRYAFNLSYEIDLWGKIRNLSEAAFEELLASVENRRMVVLTLVANVARSYILLRQLDRELEIAQKIVDERREYLYLANLRFEGGLTSEIEVMQALSIYEEAVAAVITLNTLIPLQENLISLLLGESSTCILRGTSVDHFSLPELIPVGTPCDLLVQRPDIIRMEHRLLAANANIGVARALFFPNFSFAALFGGTSFQMNTLFSKTSRAWDIGTNFLQPIFTGGKLNAQLRLTIAEKQELIAEYQETILKAIKEVNDALVSHRQAKELALVEQKRVFAVGKYLELAWLRYYDGETDYLTVLDAERQFFNAQIDLTKAQGKIFSTLVDIYASLGGGWVLEADSCLR